MNDIRDPLSSVIEEPTEIKLLPGVAHPVLVGNFVPGLKEVAAFDLTGGDWLPQVVSGAMRLAPELGKLGVPQLLASGVELDDPDKAKGWPTPTAR